MSEKRMVVAGIAAIAAAALIPSQASAETYRLSIGAGHPAASAWIATIKDHFVPRVTERVKNETGNTIEWTQAYGGSVCKLGECLEAVQSGLLDIAEINVPFDPSKVQAHNFAYFVPFGPSDPVLGAQATRMTYERVPALKTFLESRYNQVYVAAGIFGNYGLITTFDWSSNKDLVGHKIAAAGPNIPWLDGTGIRGVQSTLNDAYTSIQTGVYEGWIMASDPIVSFKLNEVAKYFSDISFGVISTPVLTMNKTRWNSLPKAVQKIILEVGEDWSKHEAEVIAAKQAEALQIMKASGVKILPPDPEQRRAWAKSLPNLAKIRFEEVKAKGQPAEAIYAYVEILKELGYVWPRDWSAER